jgi:hypothetical protein
MREMPNIAGSTYASNTVNLAAMGFAGQNQQFGQQAGLDLLYRRAAAAQGNATTFTQQELTVMSTPTTRMVQVFIADPNENIPVESRLIYKGNQKLTDATDQELFFEIDINSLLKQHNEARVKVVDKKVKERTEYLEPAKIRDLKMVVVTVAGF